ncbi:MAG: ribonuclease P protein component 1 [Candidatus Bathyarchaeota archaeon]|nr:MAG: ribonuclease P protein component 1 [Candidatus Bathyarchaeota archaeon]
MTATPAIVKHEFIGLKVKIAHCSNSKCTGIAGTIVDETRNTFVVLDGNKRKTIIKDQTIFHFTLPDSTVIEIDGNLLVGRPEERLKKRLRRLW